MLPLSADFPRALLSVSGLLGERESVKMNLHIMKCLRLFVPLVAALVLAGCGDKAPEPTAGNTSGSGDVPGTTGGHMESMRRTYHLKDLQKATLKVDGKEIQAWVMDTEDKRREGMMWLVDEDVKDNEGMIFVFSTAAPQAFWMSNTILALDIVYIGADKKVRNIQVGKPYDETSLPSDGPAQYVLELKNGCAAKFGIKKGSQFEIPDDVKSKE